MSKIRYRLVESPLEAIWDEFSLLQHADWVQSFLEQQYYSLGWEKSKQRAWQNVQPFISYIRQGQIYFQQPLNQPLWISPILLYYGIMHLCKAWALTFCPDYPSASAVLQHGVSTRKRKRDSFRWVKDEVRIQRDGLLPLLQPRFPTYPLAAGDRFLISHLITFLPDLQESLQSYQESSPLVPVTLGSETETGMNCWIPETVLDQLHRNPPSFVRRLNSVCQTPTQFELQSDPIQSGWLALRWKHPAVGHVKAWNQGFDHPWFYENKKGDAYLWIDNHHLSSPVPELLAQYMIMFSLSMLCRYEPPLWAEIVDGHQAEDRYLIEQILTTIKRKFPNLLLNQIRGDQTIFQLA